MDPDRCRVHTKLSYGAGSSSASVAWDVTALPRAKAKQNVDALRPLPHPLRRHLPRVSPSRQRCFEPPKIQFEPRSSAPDLAGSTTTSMSCRRIAGSTGGILARACRAVAEHQRTNTGPRRSVGHVLIDAGESAAAVAGYLGPPNQASGSTPTSSPAAGQSSPRDRRGVQT